MDVEDIPEWARKELKKADHAHTEALLNAAILVAALCQQKLDVRGLVLTLQVNGDVVISTMFGADGKSSVPYAHVDRISRKIKIVGTLSAPGPEDQHIEPLIEPPKPEKSK